MVMLIVAGLMLAPAASAQQPPKPGKEHELLKRLEGTWEATVNPRIGVGVESKLGIMTYRMDLGGLWLVSDFQGDFGGQKIQGHGLDTYDPAKKKYIGIWVNSLATTPWVAEGNFDKDGKVLTMTGEGPGMDGKPGKFKMVSEMKDKDTMIVTMSSPDKEDKDQVMLTITYKRKK